MFRLGNHPVECPHCGRRIVYDLWGHVLACAKERQRRLDRDFNRRFNGPSHGGMAPAGVLSNQE